VPRQREAPVISKFGVKAQRDAPSIPKLGDEA
jgi:hypothetical protein